MVTYHDMVRLEARDRLLREPIPALFKRPFASHESSPGSVVGPRSMLNILYKSNFRAGQFRLDPVRVEAGSYIAETSENRLERHPEREMIFQLFHAFDDLVFDRRLGGRIYLSWGVGPFDSGSSVRQISRDRIEIVMNEAWINQAGPRLLYRGRLLHAMLHAFIEIMTGRVIECFGENRPHRKVFHMAMCIVNDVVNSEGNSTRLCAADAYHVEHLLRGWYPGFASRMDLMSTVDEGLDSDSTGDSEDWEMPMGGNLGSDFDPQGFDEAGTDKSESEDEDDFGSFDHDPGFGSDSRFGGNSHFGSNPRGDGNSRFDSNPRSDRSSQFDSGPGFGGMPGSGSRPGFGGSSTFGSSSRFDGHSRGGGDGYRSNAGDSRGPNQSSGRGHFGSGSRGRFGSGFSGGFQGAQPNERKPGPAIDPYKVLGVGRNATKAEIKKAYHGLAKQHHPDKAQNQEDREKTTKRMAEVNEAYEILEDDVRKEAYDNGFF